MSNAPTNVSQKGKRYTDAEKQEVVDFVEQYNAENRRGGQSVAATKFGVSQLTISSWLKSLGAAKPKKASGKAPKAAKAPKAGKTAKTSKAPKAAAASNKGGINATLSSLLSISQQIEQTESELAQLKAKFQSLKASL